MSDPTPSKPTPEERIRELAKKSSIGASDAARLLAAVKTEPLPLDRKFDPFTRLSPTTGTLIGFVVSGAAAAVSRLGIRYDGVLDVVKAADVGWQRAALDQVAAFLLPAAVLWIAGYLLTRRGRAVDMLSTVGVARGPAKPPQPGAPAFPSLADQTSLPSAQSSART